MKANTCLFTVIFISWLCPWSLAADPLDNWTLRNPLPTPNNLRAVTAGNGLLVAVGTVGTIATSTDAGDTWAAQDSTQTNPNLNLNLASVAYGNGRFVAVPELGSQDAILTSPNGTNWTANSIVFSDPTFFTGITFGGGTFVAVGYGAITNGTASATSSGSRLPQSQVFNTGSTQGTIHVSYDFYAVPDQMTIIYSGTNIYDSGYISGTGEFDLNFGPGTGTSVTIIMNQFTNPSPISTWQYSVAVAGQAGTATNVILTSTNGLVWTRRSAGINTALNGVTYAQNQFVAVGGISSPTNRGVILTSPDGVTWTTRRTTVPARLTSVAGNATGFVAVGGRTTSRSPTGVTWTDATDAAGPARNTVAAGTNLFASTDATYGVGDASTFYTSPDGASWSNRATASSISGITFSNGRFIAVGTVNDPGFSALGTRPAIYLSADGITWSSRYRGFRNLNFVKPPKISAAAFGNGIFIALMTPQGLASSTNGTDWSGSSYASGGVLPPLGLTFAAGQFVVVGGSDTVSGTAIATSTNGSVWTTSYTGSDGQLTAVTYGGGQYVAVGRRAAGDQPVLTSPDAINWTVQSAGITENLFGVAFGGGAFVAVGAAGSVARSTDGVNWSTQSISATNQLRGVTFAGGQFVAVGDWGSIFTSPNGSSWTRRTSGSTRDLNTVTYFNNRFVAGGDLGTVLTSTDGINWSATDADTDLVICATATGANTLLLAGEASLLDTSTNGLAWVVRDAYPPTDLLLRHVLQMDDRILAFSGGGLARSTTGRSWALMPASGFTASTHAAYTNGVLVVVGTEEIAHQTRISVSTNRGDSFVDASLGTLGQLYGLIYAKGLFVATGENSPGPNGVILTSPDGFNWTPRNSGLNATINDIAFGNNLFVAVGDSGGVQSTDGINWTPNPGAKGETVTFGGGKFVAAGAGASVSTNGTLWFSTLTNTVSIDNVRNALGTFVAVGPSGIYTSTNGLNWTNRFVRTKQKLNAVEFVNDSFFAVGFGGTIYQSEFLTNTPAAILQGPQGRTNIAGSTATFSASYNGRLPLRFQWFKNGTAITGATDPSLTLPGVASSDAGSYHVLVINDTGSQASADAMLTVANIGVGVNPEFLYLFTNTTGGFSASITGGTPISYQWRKNSTLIAGATNSTLMFTNVLVSDGNYYVVANLGYGQMTSTNSGYRQVISSLDEISFDVDPMYQAVPISGTASINAVVYGPAPISYQWRKNDVVIAGATNATLVFTNAQLTNSADYTYSVTYTLGSLTNTSPSTLAVYYAEPPVITDSRLISPGTLRMIFTGLTNRYYQIDYAASLTPPIDWQYYDSVLLATNPVVYPVYLPALDPNTQGYFRIEILPP